MDPSIIKTFKIHGIIALRFYAAVDVISPPYTTTAPIPVNCFNIMQCIAAKRANLGVDG